MPPTKPRNKDVRNREHLTPTEIELVIDAAKGISRHGHRGATLILLAYRHGLRVSELLSLQWSHVDLKQGNYMSTARRMALTQLTPCLDQKYEL